MPVRRLPYPFHVVSTVNSVRVGPDTAEPCSIPAGRTSRREIEELVRLAQTVLDKSPADLAAIADDNAAMQAGWIDAFEAHRARAEAEARFWSAAIAYLMASAPRAVANDDGP